MPIKVKHGGGLPGLAGLLSGQGRYAARESQLRGQDLARIYGEQFQTGRLREQLSSREQTAAANNRVRQEMQATSLQAQRQNSQRQIQAQAQRDSQAADQAY